MSAVKLPIFIDNHSTTQVDPRVLDTMLPYFTRDFGNAASRNHVFGWTAETAVEHARTQVAALIGGDAKEIVWTSGATEANNLAIKGAVSFYRKQGNHIITVQTEHKSVLDTCKQLEREVDERTFEFTSPTADVTLAIDGRQLELAARASLLMLIEKLNFDPAASVWAVASGPKTVVLSTRSGSQSGVSVLDPGGVLREVPGSARHVTYLRPGRDGLVTPQQVADAVTPKTVLVTIMLANNEIGVVQDVDAIGAAIKAKNPKTLFHIDAVQGAGKVPFDVHRAKADLVSLSAHKMYGPKGVGALWVRRKPRVRIDPIIDGGGHERGMRSGTLPVPLIVGFGKAAELAKDEMSAEALRLAALRDRLYRGITSKLPETYVNGSLERRLPGNLNVSFAFVEGESLLMALKDVAVSSGSACTSTSLEPSYVLHALGIGDDLAHTSIRFGIGRFNTEAEIDFVIDLVVKCVERLRALSPLWEMHQDGIDLNSIQWKPH
jgi:cysteine desulfurase